MDVVHKLVQCIKRLVYGFPAMEEELASLILEDNGLFQETNKNFNKIVLFPLLFGEETVSLSINPYLRNGERRYFLSLPDEAPVALNAYAKSLAQDGFPFATTILSPEQKRMFSQFMGGNLTPAQLLALQFFKPGSEYNLSEGNFSSQCALVAFGSAFYKQHNITYTVGLVTTNSVEGTMQGKVPATSSTYLLIYTDEPRYVHLKLKTGTRKNAPLFFKLDKRHYFPSKENFFFKLELGSHSSNDPMMFNFAAKKPSLKEEAFSALEPEDYRALKWPDNFSIPLKMSSA